MISLSGKLSILGIQGEVRIVYVPRLLGEFFELEDPTDIILILRRLSKILPSRFLIKVFFAEIKYGVHRSNGNICVRVVLFFFVVI